jgi:plastocyanin
MSEVTMRRAAGVMIAVALLVLSSGPIAGATASPQGPSPEAVATISPRVNFTLFGNAVAGWGFTSASLTKPGPILSLYLGDEVSLDLTGTDTSQHNWFLDFNNNSQADPGEPASPNFNGPGDPKNITFSFAADQAGNWTYRCGFHRPSMWGMVQVRPKGRPMSATLVGSSTRGWGLSNATISVPGPSILVGENAHVTLTLLANDSGNSHNWFIDYDNSTQPDPNSEPTSKTFGGPTDPKSVVFSFNATRTGHFTYRCEFHPTKMVGTITILGPASPPPSGLGVGIVPGVLLVALAGVLVFAAVYQVRAMRAARRRP